MVGWLVNDDAADELAEVSVGFDLKSMDVGLPVLMCKKHSGILNVGLAHICEYEPFRCEVSEAERHWDALGISVLQLVKLLTYACVYM